MCILGKALKKCCLSPIIYQLCSEYFTTEALDDFGNFKVGRQVISSVKCADDDVQLANEKLCNSAC